ncbi:Phage protein [Streptococcus sp. DD10]|nr:Phage protein [Streptococcus sp. DD10]
MKMKGMNRINGYLSYNKNLDKWFFGIASESKPYRARHTRKELEEANFGWVFDCEGIEVEEVNF